MGDRMLEVQDLFLETSVTWGRSSMKVWSEIVSFAYLLSPSGWREGILHFMCSEQISWSSSICSDLGHCHHNKWYQWVWSCSSNKTLLFFCLFPLSLSSELYLKMFPEIVNFHISLHHITSLQIVVVVHNWPLLFVVITASLFPAFLSVILFYRVISSFWKTELERGRGKLRGRERKIFHLLLHCTNDCNGWS